MLNIVLLSLPTSETDFCYLGFPLKFVYLFIIIFFSHDLHSTFLSCLLVFVTLIIFTKEYKLPSFLLRNFFTFLSCSRLPLDPLSSHIPHIAASSLWPGRCSSELERLAIQNSSETEDPLDWVVSWFCQSFRINASLVPTLQWNMAAHFHVVPMLSSLFWDVMQRTLVVTDRRFGATYRSHIARVIWPLKMETTGCPEKLVTTSLLWVVLQKIENVFCRAAEASIIYNHAVVSSLSLSCQWPSLKSCVKTTLFVRRSLWVCSGFGGLEVASWPLVPKFGGSNPTEVVGFFRAKKSSAPLPSEWK